MKKLLFIALLGLTIAACSKKTDTVTPDAASLVSGTYVMNYIRQDSAGIKSEINLPIITSGKTLASGTMTIAKTQTANTVNLKVHLVVSGSPDEDDDFGNFTLQQNGSSYDLYDGTTKYGTVDGTNLSYDETYTGTDKVVRRLILTAKK